MPRDSVGRGADRESAVLLRLAAVTAAAAAIAVWFTLYRSLPTYPPRLGWPLAVAAILFLSALILLHRLHRHAWPGIAQLGFIVSAAGLAAWIVGGFLNALGLRPGEPDSIWGRFALELIAQPQPGWGLFSVGLIPIGLIAIRSPLSLPMRFLFSLGALFILGMPLKYVLGERVGGLIVLFAFGAGWLAVGALLLVESRRVRV
jgi:hypothetical protein